VPTGKTPAMTPVMKRKGEVLEVDNGTAQSR
jgi:hypothetical protein